jgi:hypothetical protein
LIEARIGEGLAGTLFAITLDVWTEKAQHTLCCSFAVFMKNGMAKETMLSCAPIEINAIDPVGYQTDEHNK